MLIRQELSPFVCVLYLATLPGLIAVRNNKPFAFGKPFPFITFVAFNTLLLIAIKNVVLKEKDNVENNRYVAQSELDRVAGYARPVIL
jgi:hypothetical protein